MVTAKEAPRASTPGELDVADGALGPALPVALGGRPARGTTCDRRQWEEIRAAYAELLAGPARVHLGGPAACHQER